MISVEEMACINRYLQPILPQITMTAYRNIIRGVTVQNYPIESYIEIKGEPIQGLQILVLGQVHCSYTPTSMFSPICFGERGVFSRKRTHPYTTIAKTACKTIMLDYTIATPVVDMMYDYQFTLLQSSLPFLREDQIWRVLCQGHVFQLHRSASPFLRASQSLTSLFLVVNGSVTKGSTYSARSMPSSTAPVVEEDTLESPRQSPMKRFFSSVGSPKAGSALKQVFSTRKSRESTRLIHTVYESAPTRMPSTLERDRETLPVRYEVGDLFGSVSADVYRAEFQVTSCYATILEIPLVLLYKVLYREQLVQVQKKLLSKSET